MYTIEYKHSYKNDKLIEELTYISDGIKYISKFINGGMSKRFEYLDGGLCRYIELLNGEIHGIVIETMNIIGDMDPNGYNHVSHYIHNQQVSVEEYVQYIY